MAQAKTKRILAESMAKTSMPEKTTSKLKSITVRCSPEMYAEIEDVRWRARLSMQEFMLRAAALQLTVMKPHPKGFPKLPQPPRGVV